jgi:transcriptional regulator with XRE-family HTH domain
MERDCTYHIGCAIWDRNSDRFGILSWLAWRVALGLSRAKLAEAIGFSPSQIQDYEQGARRGKQGADAAISDAAWLRYGLACAALSAGLKTPF